MFKFTISLPALSPTMTEGRIASFHVKVGDKVNEGDNIFDVQTDKDAVPNMCNLSINTIS